MEIKNINVNQADFGAIVCNSTLHHCFYFRCLGQYFFSVLNNFYTRQQFGLKLLLIHLAMGNITSTSTKLSLFEDSFACVLSDKRLLLL